MITIYGGCDSEGDLYCMRGKPAPVAGLAVVPTQCACDDPLKAIVHIRSGGVLFFVHGAGLPNRRIWDLLAHVDWDCTAGELVFDGQVCYFLRRALISVPDAFADWSRTGHTSSPELPSFGPWGIFAQTNPAA